MKLTRHMAIFAAVAALAAAGCGNETDEFVIGPGFTPSPSATPTPTPTPNPIPETAFLGLDATGTALVRFQSGNTSAAQSVPLTNLPAGTTLVGIDVRPQTNGLYGLGFNPTTSTVQLFAINPENGRVDAIGTPGTPATPITGSAFGFDFNPAVDRIRVVTDTGRDFRMNPNNGAIVDLNLDGAINGPTTSLDGAAYTNNEPNNGGVTTLYTIDATTQRLYLQNPPNSGTQTSPLQLTSNGLPINFTNVNGFDIPPGVNAPASNSPATGAGFAALTSGNVTRLYQINLATGAAIAAPGALGQSLRGLTVVNFNGPKPLLGLTGTTLVRFNNANPGNQTSVNVSGVNATEVLVGCDYRPATGQLYGLGIDAATDRGSVYLLDPQTGNATAIGTQGAIAFTTAAGNVVDFPPNAAGYGVDFNPTVDRMRVTTGTGLNFRVNQLDGTPIDGDTAANGTQPDGNINGLPAGSTGVSGAAYTNNFSGAVNTTLYTLDATSDSLFIQNPANAGNETSQVQLRLNGTPIDFTAVNGFEIARQGGPQILIFPNSDPSFVALTVGNTTSVYSLNLLSGALTLLGGSPVGLTGLTGGNSQ